MTTQVTYNGIVLKDVQTKRFNEAVTRDESGTDLLYHQYSIRVEGLVHTNIAGDHVVVPQGNPASAVQAMNAVKAQLMHPRGDFRYAINGETLVYATHNFNSPQRDVNNGPHPQHCDIMHIAGYRVFRIEFEIEVCIVDCGGQQSPGTIASSSEARAHVLNNRWSIEDTVDEDQYWTRTIEGTLRVAHIDVNPHQVRRLVTPPLQKGYRREGGRFVSTPDGLTLKYTITDKQHYAAAPPPATSWEGTYTESTGVGGAKGHAEVAVMMKGPTAADKRELVTRCAQVVQARLGDLRRNYQGDAQAVLLQSAYITEYLHDNKVEMRVRVLRVAAANKYLNVVTQKLGTDLNLPDYDRLQHLIPKLYDANTPAGVYAMYLQSPCSDKHGVPQVYPIDPDEEEPREDSYEPQYESYQTVGDNIPEDEQTGYSSDQGNNFYTYVEIDSRYKIKTGIKQLAIASPPQVNVSTSAFVSLHGQTAQRIFTMRAERVGEYPILPEIFTEQLTDENGIDEYLLETEIVPTSPEALPDSKMQLYKVEVRMTYGLSRAPTATEILRTGAQPFGVASPQANHLDLSTTIQTGVVQ